MGETQPMSSNCLEKKCKIIHQPSCPPKLTSPCGMTSCSLTPSNILNCSNLHKNELAASAVRCCENLHGSIPKSPCGYFYGTSIYNTCRFKNSFGPTSLQNGLTGYVPINPKMRGIGRQISSHTLHSIESVNDLRSWSVSEQDRTKYFLEQMRLSAYHEYGFDHNENNPQLYDDLRDPPYNLLGTSTGMGVGANGVGNSRNGGADQNSTSGGNSGGSGGNGGLNLPNVHGALGDNSGSGSDSGGNGKRSGSGPGSGAASGSDGEGGGRSGVNKRGMSGTSQTPPLALANLVDAMDDEEKKRLFDELLKAEHLGSTATASICANKDEEIKKLMNRVKELQRYQNGAGHSSGELSRGSNAGSCVIETTLDFDNTMKPVNVETRMNYVITPSRAAMANSPQNQALVNDPDSGVGDSYTFELETTCDFKLDEASGELSFVGTQGKIIPIESHALVSKGNHSSRSNSRSNTIERTIQSAPPLSNPNKTQDTASGPSEEMTLTLNDTIAGGNERNLHKQDEIDKLLCQERGKTSQLNYQMEQQQIEIANLQRRLQEAEQSRNSCSNQQTGSDLSGDCGKSFNESKFAICPVPNSTPETVANHNAKIIKEILRLENMIPSGVADPVVMTAMHDLVRRGDDNINLSTSHVTADMSEHEKTESGSKLENLLRDSINLSAELDRLATLVRGCDRIPVDKETANQIKSKIQAFQNEESLGSPPCTCQGLPCTCQGQDGVNMTGNDASGQVPTTQEASDGQLINTTAELDRLATAIQQVDRIPVDRETANEIREKIAEFQEDDSIPCGCTCNPCTCQWSQDDPSQVINMTVEDATFSLSQSGPEGLRQNEESNNIESLNGTYCLENPQFCLQSFNDDPGPGQNWDTSGSGFPPVNSNFNESYYGVGVLEPIPGSVNATQDEYFFPSPNQTRENFDETFQNQIYASTPYNYDDQSQLNRPRPTLVNDGYFDPSLSQPSPQPHQIVNDPGSFQYQPGTDLSQNEGFPELEDFMK